MVLNIIPLNTKDNNSRPRTGAPVSGDESSVYSALVNPPTESEVYFVSDDDYYGPPNYPSPTSYIPSPSQP